MELCRYTLCWLKSGSYLGTVPKSRYGLAECRISKLKHQNPKDLWKIYRILQLLIGEPLQDLGTKEIGHSRAAEHNQTIVPVDAAFPDLPRPLPEPLPIRSRNDQTLITDYFPDLIYLIIDRGNIASKVPDLLHPWFQNSAGHDIEITFPPVVYLKTRDQVEPTVKDWM